MSSGVIIEDIKIPIPYGVIAVKVWRSSLQEPLIRVIALHGRLDNAATFDRLIPLLKLKEFIIVAIDLPGHGLSTHLPPGIPYEHSSWTLSVKRVAEYFHFDKFTILGHSMGASIAYFYASIFPQEVERVIALDHVTPPLCKDMRDFPLSFGNMLMAFLNLEKKYPEHQSQPKTFTYQEAVEVLMTTHNRNGVQMSEAAAKALVTRAAKPSTDGGGRLVFTGDSRLNALLSMTFDGNTLQKVYSHMTCEVLVILARQGLSNLKNPYSKLVFDGFAKMAKRFKCVEIDGDHYVHLNQPEVVADFINDYLHQNSNGSEMI